ncbi:MAG: ABC transporter permease [Eubacterium sp.]|nr:ABC transporter permease [Eubacterium sp.]
MKQIVLWMHGFYKYKNLLKQLVSRDIKLKYRRSVLGYLWSVLNPLFVMLIMVVVFSSIFRSDVENFPLYLISGQILFNYMSEATNGAIQSVLGASGLLRKIYVPKYIFTISKVTSTLITMLFSLLALLLVALATNAPVSLNYVLIVLPIGELYLFCLGLGLFLAQAAVFFRDIQYIYSVVLTAWMYLTPIFYPVTMLPETLQFCITRLNPMYYYLEQFRQIVMYGTAPSGKLLLYGLLTGLLALLAGAWCFQKTQDQFVLYV